MSSLCSTQVNFFLPFKKIKIYDDDDDDENL